MVRGRAAPARRAAWPFELNRERLIEDREKIRILVDAILEGAVAREDLHELRIRIPFSLRAAARVAGARVETPRAVLSPNGQSLISGILDARRRLDRRDAIDVFAGGRIRNVGARTGAVAARARR